jgi:DNA helicase-2/ATP-dependent DNA helicase PcrA
MEHGSLNGNVQASGPGADARPSAESILEDMNPRQREAVMAPPGPLLMVAGPGSGKTRVLTHRIAYLIRHYNVPPERIVALTFTNQAADEMRTRTARLVGEDAVGEKGVWLGTFHAFGLRLLRRLGPQLGLGHFVLVDESDKRSIIRKIQRDMGLDPSMHSVQDCSLMISNVKNQGRVPNDATLGEIFRAYDEKLARERGLDFDDLVMLPPRLLRGRPQVAEMLGQRISHLLVDEYQDVGDAESRFLAVLASALRPKDAPANWQPSVAVVGDEDQSIYAFRRADPRYFLAFPKTFPNTRVVKLERNYRSTPQILESAQRLVRNNKTRMKKQLFSKRAQGPLPRIIATLDEGDEARAIVDEVRRLEGEGIPLEEMAVLYRIHLQSRPFEEAMQAAEVRFHVIGGRRFGERDEVRDVAAYLRLILAPHDRSAFEHAATVPARGVGPATLKRVFEECDVTGGNPVDLALSDSLELPAQRKKGLHAFGELIKELTEQAKTASLLSLVEAVVTKSGYIELIAKSGRLEAQTAWEGLAELKGVAESYGNLPAVKTLPVMLEKLQLTEDKEAGRGVTLMTLHSAKGREFRAVFIVGCEEGLLPHRESAEQPMQLEEERRLCYVGMTRAKDRLAMSYAVSRTLVGRMHVAEPSRFLDELEDTAVRVTGGVIKMAKRKGGLSKVRINQRVKHPRWGEGTVLRIEGEGPAAEITVNFTDGHLRKMVLAYAPLTDPDAPLTQVDVEEIVVEEEVLPAPAPRRQAPPQQRARGGQGDGERQQGRRRRRRGDQQQQGGQGNGHRFRNRQQNAQAQQAQAQKAGESNGNGRRRRRRRRSRQASASA